MRRRLNIWLLIWLMVPVILLGTGIAGLHDLQVKRNASALLEQANRAEAQGDLGKTEESLKHLLGFEPGNPVALAKYGMILAQRAKSTDDRIQALQTLEQALRLDPHRRDLRRRLVDVAMDLKWFSDARTHLKILLDKGEPGDKGKGRKYTPEDGELEYLLGRCLEGTRDYAKAALWYTDAIAHAPQQIDSYVRVADLLRNHLDDANGADRVMDARQVKGGLIAANGRSSRSYLERGRYRKQYEIEGAEQDVARALELAPKEPDVLLTAAAFALDRGDFDEARRHLTLGLAHHPRNWRMFDALAWVERKTGHPKEAEVCLRRGIDALADPEGCNQLNWVLADVLIDEGKWAEARRVIERMGQEGVRPELLRYLQARASVGEAKWIEATKELEAVHPLLGDTPKLAYQADLLLGRCYEQLGDLDRRYAAFRRAVTLDPLGVPGHLGLASTLEAMGKFDEALGEYRRVIDQAPSTGTAVARLLVLRNLRRPAAQRDWQGVEQALDKTERVMPGSTEVMILRAEAFVAQGQPDRARDLLKRASDQQPDRVELYAALADLVGRQESPERALSILKEAERRLGDRIELRLARISHWAKFGGSGAPKALADLARDLATLTAGDQERLLQGLADAHLQIGDTAGAYRLMSQLVRQRPIDLRLRFSQLALALQVGDEAAMRRILEKIRDLEDALQTLENKGGAFWRCGQARYLIWLARRESQVAIKKEQLDEARLLLTEAGSRRPSWSLVPLSEAEIDDLVGNPKGAITHFLQAIALGEQSPAVIRRTVQLLYDRRRYDQADAVVRKMQEQGPGSGDPQFQRLAAEVSLRANNPARALELARESVPPDSKDSRDHLWLGQILWAAGEQVEAEMELRRAVELADGAPDAWVMLVQYLARTGHKEEAEAVIEQARDRLSGEQGPPAFARCYAELGQMDQAREQFRAALAARPDDVATLRGAATFALASGQVSEAKADLRKIIDLKTKAPDDATWARRLLAIVLASSGDDRQSLQALELMGLVDEGTSSQPAVDEPVEELRAKAKVLALRKNRAARRAAIRIFQQIIEREPPTPDDKFLLVQLYEAEGDWPEAHEQMLSLLATDGEDPLYLAHSIRSLLRHGDADEAQFWLRELEKLESQAYRTLELKARLLKARGQAGEAVALLKAFVEEEPDRVGSVAMLLEELGQMAAAEELYRQFASQSRQPKAILVLAGFVGRQNRLSEALELCEKARASCPPEAVADATVAVLYSAPTDEAQSRRAAQSLELELGKSPSSAVLLFHLANIRCLQGRYQEAEMLYRRSIARDKTNSGPLNNLAWLLANKDGKGAEALELLSQAMLLDGPAPDLLDTRAVAFLAMGRIDPAIKDLEDAVVVGPSPVKYIHLARAYLMARRRNEADAALQSAKAAGLRAEILHPLEREAYRRLLKGLAQR